MMWQFTILDRNDSPTVIEEPVGWADVEIELMRDLEKHGIVDDYSANDFLFPGRSGRMIKAEYDQYGIRGKMTLVIKYRCAGALEELYRGALLFGKYEYICGDECYARIPVETTSDVMDITNKWEQKANLQAVKAFDGTTDLVPYDKLPFTISLPSKGIFLRNLAQLQAFHNKEVLFQDLDIEYDGNPSAYNFGWFQIVPQIDLIKYSELGRFTTAAQPENQFICSGFYDDDKCPDLFKVRNGDIAGTVDRTLYFDWSSCTPALFNSEDGNNMGFIEGFDLELQYSLRIDTKNTRIIFLNKVVLIRRKDGSFEILSNVQEVSATGNIASPGGYVTGTYWAPDTTNTTTESLSLSNINLENGDYLFVFVAGLAQYINTDAAANLPAFNLISNSGEIEMISLSKSDPTPAKVFLVNEAISRVAEAVSNDKIRAYSEYFGRTDSQPYSHDFDGYGSLEALTKGIFIRQQENRIPDKPFTINLSLKDLWDGLDPIHHLGMGIEPDTNRPGYSRLRVEHWKYFYNDTVIMRCIGVNKIQRQIVSSEHYSAFTFGYNKWEAEEFNGLDEFLTKRQYRTQLEQIKNTLTKLSTFIGSGYAWEITRRKGSNDSKDWRYDNDTFIVCCKRQDGDTIVVELGNAINTENIIDPDSLYNFRITPARNAMRWIDKVFSGYKTSSAEDKIIFMDGDGNYHAKGEMLSSSYKIENQPLEENQDIVRALFNDAVVAMSILSPERIVFDFPMSAGDFKAINANRYGMIEYVGCEDGFGWIDKIIYKANDGIANFRLIPSFADIPPLPLPIGNYIIQEDSIPIYTEDGFYIIPE